MNDRPSPASPRRLARPRYLAPVVGDPLDSPHLAAACQVAADDGGQVVALMIGLVPGSLPIGSDVPELWARLEYQAARARRLGRERGVEIEAILVLADQAGSAVVQLAEECRASAICLAYEPGLLAALRRWRDPLWRTIMDDAPCPLVLERVVRPPSPTRQSDEPAGRPVAAER